MHYSCNSAKLRTNRELIWVYILRVHTRRSSPGNLDRRPRNQQINETDKAKVD